MRSMRWSLTGVVLVLVSCGGGYSPSSSDAGAGAGAEVAYKVGDTGPGGGIIIYVDEAGFDSSSGDDTSIGAMCLMDTCNYLEMATSNLEILSWDDAMAAAEAFSTPSVNDWLIPTKDALNEMCKYAFGDMYNAICNDNSSGTFTNSISSLSGGWYWSSSKYDDVHAWLQHFKTGGQSDGFKLQPFNARPVRAF